MKKMMLLVSVTMFAVGANAQTNFYTSVTNLWYNGHKSNVLAMAEARLAQNTNDMAGLIIKIEYDIDFTQRHSISNSINHALLVGQTITLTNFAKVFPYYKECLLWTLDEVKDNPLSPAQILHERTKGNFKHFHFSARKELEALLKDGYFD